MTLSEREWTVLNALWKTGGAERQYTEHQRSESISNSSFVNISTEEKTRARIEGFLSFCSCSFCL